MTLFMLPKDLPREKAIERIAAFLARLSPELAWSITVEQKKPRRSHQQNAYLWGVCYAELAKALPGWEADDIHEYMLGECYGWERIEGMGRVRLKPLKRSSGLSTTEFMDFIDFVQRKAAEHGIYIPNPNEDHEAAA